MYKSLIRPVLFQCDAERVHDLSIRAGAWFGRRPALCRMLARRTACADARLEREVCGLRFANPIGLAAGYDKSGKAIAALAALGYGFLEIGSVSADPSSGNPKPRLFRLPKRQAIVVNYGLPNDGAGVVAERIRRRNLGAPLGVNIVKTNNGRAEGPEAIFDDYVRGVNAVKDVADYLVLNLSCPNTESGQNFFAEGARITEVLQRIENGGVPCPLFLKVSPLGGVRAIEGLLQAVAGLGSVSGFIFNLAPGKPAELGLAEAETRGMPGAVSGKPCARLIDPAIAELYGRMDRARYCIIGAGGVFTAEDAYRKIRLGASLVQLFTAMVYEGPGIVRRINEGLLALLERDGFNHISEAVGADFQ